MKPSRAMVLVLALVTALVLVPVAEASACDPDPIGPFCRQGIIDGLTGGPDFIKPCCTNLSPGYIMCLYHIVSN
uniref:Uncharacterized protein n=1 Tax=Aegilops tauschii TaxID=37682 RepID=R7VZ16_AEGTA